MKKSKLGTHADGLTPQERQAAMLKSNNQRSHLSHGASEDAMNVPASENDNMSPEQRFADRGMQNVPKAKRRRTSYKQGY